MKYTSLAIRTLLALLVLQFSQLTVAIELTDAKVPLSLKKAYNARYKDPFYCIEGVNSYFIQQSAFTGKAEKTVADKTKRLYTLPSQLQAFCYAQIEEYTKAADLLLPLLEKNTISAEQIVTLNIIALQIPEGERPRLNNKMLLKKLSAASLNIKHKKLPKYPNLAVSLQLAIANISLQTNHYRNAYRALKQTEKLFKKNKDTEQHAWLAYYYGVYYDKINHPQLASSSFMQADKLAYRHALIKLSGKVKKDIADIYQKNHRFQIALDFAAQRIELYLGTQNWVKQASGLTQHAILKRENGEYNQSLIYLFNALELIQSNKPSMLLARIYLELGRTYLLSKDKESRNLKLAQKYLHNARFHFTDLNKPRYLIESLLLLAKLNIQNQDSALAILQLGKVLQLSQNSYLPLRVQAFEMLALNYELAGNPRQAILHFKNANALQSQIKEQQFKLQQLQISEQLHLFEKTQQQQKLETENRQLQKTADLFESLSYSSTILLTVITLLLFYALRRNKRLSAAEKIAQHRLAFHPRTGLPLQHADNCHFNDIYCGVPLYYALVNIPFLSQLNELCGIVYAQKIEEKLGDALKRYFSKGVDIFQIRGNHILFIGKQKDYKNAGDFAQKIESFFFLFCAKYQLSNTISCGIVAYPFLKKADRAISYCRTLNLSSLALLAASQIRENKQQSSWVELYAIDNLQPAFFNGDLWNLGHTAIDTGIVKINSSHQDFQFNWPALNN